MWKNGIAARTISWPGSRRVFQVFVWRTLDTRFRWVSMAAFGTPVVPPVYWKTATVVAGSPGWIGAVPGVRIARRHDRTRGPLGKRVGMC